MIIEYCKRWPINRFAAVFSENNEKNVNCESTNALQFKYGSIIRKKQYDLTPDLLATYSKYTNVCNGDIMLNCLNLNYDFVTQRVAMVKEEGIITSAYISIRPRSEYNGEYYCYLLKGLDSQKVFNGMGTGIRRTLSYALLKNMTLPVPPRTEQDQIVHFLNWKISGINKLINIKKKEIKELEDLKKTIINKAVTKGLDDSVELMDCGDVWVKTIPSHWGCAQIRRNYIVILGKMLAPNPSSNDDSLERYVCAKDVHFGEINFIDLKKMWYSQIEKRQYLIQKGDLLVVEGGAGAGNAAVVNAELQRDIYVQNSIHIIRPRTLNASTKYLYYWLFDVVSRGYMKNICSVATIPHFTKDKVLSTPMPVPPITEQENIVEFLDNKIEEIDVLIKLKLGEIENLHELKNRIICDVVTGKIDVRDIEIPEYEFTVESADSDSENADFEVDEEQEE